MTAHTRHQPDFFKIAWPLFLELALGMVVGLVGTALASHLSDHNGAAFALTIQIFYLFFILFRLIGAGVSVVITQNLGGGRRAAADQVARASLGANTWMGLPAGLIAFVGAANLLGWMNVPAEVFPLALPFLQVLAPVLLLDAWNASMASVMRAHLRTREVLAVIIAMHVLHLGLAFPLMQGWWGLPRLGLVGYGVALLTSRAFGVMMHVLLWRIRLNLMPKLDDWWALPRKELAAILHIGLPSAVENIGYRLAFTVSVAVVAQLGAAALATQAYVLQLIYCILLFGLATGLSVEIVVGHQIGAGHLHAAHRLVRRALALGWVITLVIAILAAWQAPRLMGIFTQDEAIIRAGTTLLWISVILEPGRTFNLVVINALRATGDVRYPAIVGAASMLVVLAGGSWFFGVFLGWGLIGVWVAYAADEWLRGLLMWRRWARHGWVAHARATHRRLRHATH